MPANQTPEGKKIKRILRVGREEMSGLSSFVERPVPTTKEVTNFERVVHREAREQEIDSNLSEIYRDGQGQPVDVKTMKVKKKTLAVIRFFRRLLILGLLAIVGYFVYFFYFTNSNDISGLDFKISAPEKILAGEEFSYRLDYHNPTKYPLSALHLEVQYPSNFIFSSASVPPSSGNYGWDLNDLAPGGNASLTITGKLLATPDSANIMNGHLSYRPGSFSSQFQKDASASTLISGLGFDVDLDYSATAFLNQSNDLNLIFSNIENNYLGDLNITFGLPNEANAAAATTTPAAATSSKNIIITKTGGASWQISGLKAGLDRQIIPLTYIVKQKSDNLEIRVRLEKRLTNGESHVVWEKAIRPELVTSDLNFTMLLNGSKNDGAINFGGTLNYSLTYANKGGSAYNDVVIMAALNGDFLDWNSLQDSQGGTVQNKTILWTKNEIPALAEIKPGQTGAIDFSIGLRPFQPSDLGKSLTVTAYGQYSINNKAIKGPDNKSNTITGRINSDLSLNEKILYFNADNIPVGSGPLPPRVGEKTSFKVYWTVTNSLHELSDGRVVLPLAPYLSWENTGSTNIGNVYYDEVSHQIIWEIGRLPLAVLQASAEFTLSLTPTDSDRNKILVLSPGSILSAMDTETKDTITKKTGAKTTRLEDDDIAGLNNSGIVQ